MALFSIGEIKFTPQTPRFRNALGNPSLEVNGRPAEPSQGGSAFGLHRYPFDVGNTDKGHYVMFHINEQVKTSYPFVKSNDEPTIFKNRRALQEKFGAQNLGGVVSDASRAAGQLGNKIQELYAENVRATVQKQLDDVSARFGIKYTPNDVTNEVNRIVSSSYGAVTDAIGKLSNVNFLRTIRRTRQHIALYMPNTLNFAQNQGYSDPSLGGELANKLRAGYSIAEAYARGEITGSQLGQNVSPFIFNAITSLAGNVIGPNSSNAILASLIGGVQNPQIELIYTSPSLRDFQFEFMFYPRSEQEAVEVQRIIQAFKFHQSPEIMQGTAGYFLVPPSEFDIEFYWNGQINHNIPKISTCVLTTTNVDYAPHGFVAYESISDTSLFGGRASYLGETGMPAAIRLTLTFKETEIMTKENFSSDLNV